MAYEEEDNEGNEDQVESQQGGATLVSQPAGIQSPGSGQPTPSAGGKGSRFATLQEYMGSNPDAGQKIGQTIGQGIQSQAQGALSGLQSSQAQTQSQLEAQAQRQNIASQAQAGIGQTSVADRQNIRDFIAQPYTGPNSFEAGAKERADLAEAQARAKNLETDAGQTVELKKAFQRPDYSAGQLGLDQALFNVGGKEQLRGIKESVDAAGGQFNQGVLQTQKQIDDLRLANAEKAGATRANLESLRAQFATTAQQRAAEENARNQALVSEYQNALSSAQGRAQAFGYDPRAFGLNANEFVNAAQAYDDDDLINESQRSDIGAINEILQDANAMQLGDRKQDLRTGLGVQAARDRGLQRAQEYEQASGLYNMNFADARQRAQSLYDEISQWRNAPSSIAALFSQIGGQVQGVLNPLNQQISRDAQVKRSLGLNIPGPSQIGFYLNPNDRVTTKADARARVQAVLNMIDRNQREINDQRNQYSYQALQNAFRNNPVGGRAI